jgi:hypothetical protein
MDRAVVTETEWWDRIAVAVELLEKLPGAARRRVEAAGRSVQWVGDGPVPGAPAADARPADATAYVFPSLKNVEILRRITQMPDETPLDMLAVPFAVYCPDMAAFVAVNMPEVPLEEHLKRLEENRP